MFNCVEWRFEYVDISVVALFIVMLSGWVGWQ